MSPFRPSNINKRSYPGNANVIGPDLSATIGFSTTTCYSSNSSIAACVCSTLQLGCRCTFCGCPCCNICCACACTVCDRTVPSGMWKANEQYEARSRDAWGDDSCSSGTETCLCCTDIGYTSISNVVDYKGWFICCSGATKWWAAPGCTTAVRSWYARSQAVTVANSCMGSCGWFVPTYSQGIDPGACCQVYWHNNPSDPDRTEGGSNWSRFWSNNEFNSYGGRTYDMRFGSFGTFKPSGVFIRTFRTT